MAATEVIEVGPRVPADYPMSAPGFGKRTLSSPSWPAEPVPFAAITDPKHRRIALFIDRLPEGACAGYKSLQHHLDGIGYISARQALHDLASAGHLRRSTEHLDDGRIVTRTYWTRKPLTRAEWNDFLADEKAAHRKRVAPRAAEAPAPAGEFTTTAKTAETPAPTAVPAAAPAPATPATTAPGHATGPVAAPASAATAAALASPAPAPGHETSPATAPAEEAPTVRRRGVAPWAAPAAPTASPAPVPATAPAPGTPAEPATTWPAIAGPTTSEFATSQPADEPAPTGPATDPTTPRPSTAAPATTAPVATAPAAPPVAVPPSPPSRLACDVLRDLRRFDEDLTFTPEQITGLARILDTWLADGVTPDEATLVLTRGLPYPMINPAAVIRKRLDSCKPRPRTPEPPRPPRAAEPPAHQPPRCATCRSPQPRLTDGLCPPCREHADTGGDFQPLTPEQHTTRAQEARAALHNARAHMRETGRRAP